MSVSKGQWTTEQETVTVKVSIVIMGGVGNGGLLD